MVADEWMPQEITIVQDNLSTHSKGSFYATFPAHEARRLARHFDFHVTPKHASWLNMAESEISVFVRGCISRRIPNEATLRHEADAWAKARNAIANKAKWQFTSSDARIKLASLYPQLD